MDVRMCQEGMMRWMCAVVLVGSLLGSVSGHAEVQQRRYGVGGMGYFGIGGQGIEWGSLPEKLRQHGYGEISSWGMLIGGGGGGVIGSLFLGGEGYALVERKAMGAFGQVRMSGGWGSLLVGYTRPIGEQVRLHVLAGLGRASLRVMLRGAGVLPFDSLLQRPQGSVGMVTGGWLLQGAVGGEIRLIAGLFIGVRAGYVLPMGWGALTLESGEGVPGAPVVRLRGWAIRVVLGGAGYAMSHGRDGN